MAGSREGPGWRRLLLLAGLFGVALNLRSSVAAVGAMLGSITHSLHLSLTMAGLLTTIPVACMGICAPLGARVGAWFGAERTILGSLLLICLAAALRIAGSSVAVLYLSTLLIGVGIATAGTVIVAVVKRYFPDRAALVTGLYTVGISGGSALAASLTVPISAASGAWTLGLAAWAVPAALGAVLWGIAVPGAAGGAERAVPTPSEPLRIPWRRGRAWLVTAFFGLQALLFYTVLTWLAPAYTSRGWSGTDAGLLLSGFLALQMVAALAVPALADRFHDRRPWLAMGAACYAAGLAGIALLPDTAPWLWVVLLGGAGALFPLALTLPLDYTTDPYEASGWSALALGGGYLIAAAGPFVTGATREATGSYRTALLLVAAVALLMVVLTVWLRPVATGAPGQDCRATSDGHAAASPK